MRNKFSTPVNILINLSLITSLKKLFEFNVLQRKSNSFQIQMLSTLVKNFNKPSICKPRIEMLETNPVVTIAIKNP